MIILVPVVWEKDTKRKAQLTVHSPPSSLPLGPVFFFICLPLEQNECLGKGKRDGGRRGVGARGRTVGGLYIAASVGRYCIDRKDIVSPTEGYNEAGGGVGGEEEAPA